MAGHSSTTADIGGTKIGLMRGGSGSPLLFLHGASGAGGWLPFMDYVYSQFNETLGKAFADKTDAVAGLQAWQDACAKYAKDQGFTVA